MPVFRYFVSVGPALLALLVIIDAVFGEGPPRFNDAIYDSTLYAPRAAIANVRQERSFADDVTPADRVRQVFGQFSANDGKRLKRYSSASSAI
ncbi:hypothetical protein [Rhodopseudomonas pseudopalustris]|uniref:Uncharacterized protein n=2 Tax=Rhodopseudomonas TaxID=1073 RepID=Q137E7_RHOPS|nr:hypothetical protein [Rhodopseudomonas pseudopalustris]ABE39792.1 conserved hypothetical protein [Rhodopseudomonas palustris BisB5]SEP36827.1 hypothetical protein SAMN05444123_11829 [Rhodopseudomonas pseudopalustris]